MLLQFTAFDPEKPQPIPRKKVWINPDHVSCVQETQVNGQAPGVSGGPPVAVPLGEAIAVTFANGAQVILSKDNDITRLVHADKEGRQQTE